MTRGMLAVVLHNLEGNPNPNSAGQFHDVANDAWYAEAVCWADAEGIVSGYGDGTFGANNQIAREQLAVMLYRYAGSPAHSGQELTFHDAHNVMGFAADAMSWAVENNIINGKGGNILDPKGTTTRAQVAAILMRFVELSAK